MAKYVKLTKEQNRKCKLTDEQLVDIRARYKSGEPKKSIARDYGVTPEAIYWQCLPDEEKKRRAAAAAKRVGTNYRPAQAADTRAYRKEILGGQHEAYERELAYKLRFKKDRPKELDSMSITEKAKRGAEAAKQYWKNKKSQGFDTVPRDLTT